MESWIKRRASFLGIVLSRFSSAASENQQLQESCVSFPSFAGRVWDIQTPSVKDFVGGRLKESMSKLSLYPEVKSGKLFGEYLDFLNGRLDGNLLFGRNLCSLGRMDLFLYLKELCRLSIFWVIGRWKGRFVTEGVCCLICGWMVRCLDEDGGWSVGVIWYGKTLAKFSRCSAWGLLSEFSSKDSSESCSESVWSGKMKRECPVDLSSEWKLCLESGDLFLDLSDLDCLVDELGFATDLLFLGSFSEKSSKI